MDNRNIANSTIIVGDSNSANSFSSLIIGESNLLESERTAIIGSYNSSYKPRTIINGESNLLNSDSCFCLGSQNNISGDFNTIVGNGNLIEENADNNSIVGSFNTINSSNNLIIGTENAVSNNSICLGNKNSAVNLSDYSFLFGTNNLISPNSLFSFSFGDGLDNHLLGYPQSALPHNFIIGAYNASLNATSPEVFTIGNGISGSRNTLFKIVDNSIDPYLQLLILNQTANHKLFYSDLPLSNNYIALSAASTFVTKTLDIQAEYTSARVSNDNTSVGVISDKIRIPSDGTNPGGNYSTFYKKNGLTRTLKGNLALLIPNSDSPLIAGDLLFRFASNEEAIDSFYITAYKNGDTSDNITEVNTVLSNPGYRFDGQFGFSNAGYTRMVSLLVNSGAVYWADSNLGSCPYNDPDTSAVAGYHYLPNRLVIDTSWLE